MRFAFPPYDALNVHNASVEVLHTLPISRSPNPCWKVGNARTAATFRGRGIEIVEGGGPITTDKLNALSQVATHLPAKESIQTQVRSASVSLSVEELRAIIEFLRAKGIEVDPLREKQRKVAWALAQSFGPARVLQVSPATQAEAATAA